MDFIYKYVKPHVTRALVGMGVKLIGTIIELFLPYILAHIIDNVTPLGDMNLVYKWGALMVLCSVVGVVANVYANRNAAAVSRDSIRTLRHDLFEKIMYLSNKQTDILTIPSLISRMTSDTYIIHRMIGMIQRMGVRAPILILGGLAVTVTLDPYLAGILALTMPFLGVLVFNVSKKGLPLFKLLQTSKDEMVRVVRESASGVRVIKALSKTEFEKEKFSKVNENVMKREINAGMVMSLNGPIMNLVLNTGLVAVIIAGAYRVDQGVGEVGKIIAFMAYFVMILNAIMGITRIITMSNHSLASASRIREVMECSNELVLREIAEKENDFHIEFDNVSFSYNKRENDLENVSFSLKRGERLGIIGPTGAGKTTITALLMRFYDVDKGSVRIDGKDVRSMNLKDLRSNFGIVFQKDMVFKDSIKGNIKLGRNINDEDMLLAAESARAHDFITEAGGFEHNAFAKGMNFSGGQKQRLLISRALAGNPNILILDDSSSALDYKTDQALRTNLRQNYGDTTSIIIAQRISSVKDCDKIMVIEDGKVLGYGTHDELMQTNELYLEISKLQMGEVEIYG